MSILAIINGNQLTVRSDGLVNISQMMKASGTTKRSYDWYRNIGSKKFIAEVAKRENKLPEDMYVKDGRNGIWAHQYIALKIAGWVSPEFDVLMMSIVFRYQQGDKSLISEILEIGDKKDDTMTNVISVAPADDTQSRHTMIHSLVVAKMTANQIEKQRKLNERMPNLENLVDLPKTENGEIDVDDLDGISSENVILEIIGCSRQNLETYADIVDATKTQLAMLYNENKALYTEAREIANEYQQEIENLKTAIAHLVCKINNMEIICSGEVEDFDANLFIDMARNGLYRPLTGDYSDHLMFLRSALMDVAVSQNCVEKQQLAVVVSILKSILAPNIVNCEEFTVMPHALKNTSAHPSFFGKNTTNFTDEDGVDAVYDTFEVMGLDRPEIMLRVCSFPQEWKDTITERLNGSIVRPTFDNDATHIFIYIGYDAIFPTKKDLFIEFATQMLSCAGLSHMSYVGESHLNKTAGEFIGEIGGVNILPYDKSVSELISPHGIVSIIESGFGLLNLVN